MDAVGIALITAIGGVGGYAFGRNRGYNDGWGDGYNQAKYEDSQAILQYKSQFHEAQRGNAELIGQKNRLLQENEVLKSLLAQQPTTPQAEAILKSLHKVELRLTQALPAIFDDGANHEIQSN